jgi:8-oxo-dGTP pyrophosphatase MutT (NUDIX family)
VERSWRPGGDQIIPRPDTWRLGSDAPWADRHDGSRSVPLDATLSRVPAIGEARILDPIPTGARASAVLVALWEGNHGAEVLLTKRSWELSSHRGEISFPGGRLDPGETAVAAALREAHEEVGLSPDDVEVVGELDHLSTVASKSYIMPVVARLARRPDVAPATGEVQRILNVPLAELCRADTYRQEMWWRPPVEWPIHFFELDDETIWGATGRILVQLLTLALAD